MKKLVLAGFLLFQVSALANEVIEFQGQKIVLIKTETAQKLDAAMNSSLQGISKLNQIKTILASELELVPGGTNYCLTAEPLYNKNGSSSQNFFAKCKKVLTNRDLIEELAGGVPEYENVQGLRELVSAFLALSLLM